MRVLEPPPLDLVRAEHDLLWTLTQSPRGKRRLSFDLSRTVTVVTPRGKVHLSADNGMFTVCRLDLMGRPDWLDHRDRQPDCDGCLDYAWMHPVHFHFTLVGLGQEVTGVAHGRAPGG